MGGQTVTVNQQSDTWRAKKNGHGEAWDKDKGCWTSPWQEKLQVCSHQSRHQDFSFPSTASSYLLITLAKISTSLWMSGPRASIILKDIRSKTLTYRCYLSLRDLQGGPTGSSCASCLLQGVSVVVLKWNTFLLFVFKATGKTICKTFDLENCKREREQTPNN